MALRAGVGTVALAAAMAGPGAAAAPAQDAPLAGERIAQLIAGNTLRGGWRARPFQWAFTPDGTIYGDVGSATVSGRWEIAHGDRYCHRFSQFLEGVRRCYRWYAMQGPAGTGTRYLLRNVDAFRIGDILVWEIRPGLE